jgi:hypothetical protein
VAALLLDEPGFLQSVLESSEGGYESEDEVAVSNSHSQIVEEWEMLIVSSQTRSDWA